MSLNVPEFVIPDAATLEEKVDLLIRMMATSLQNQAKVAKLEARVLSLEDTVKKMAKEITSMKDQNNAREQLLRGHSVRIIGVPISEEESSSREPNKVLLKKVFERVIKPVLSAAKTNGHTDSVPSMNNAICEIYRVRVGLPQAQGVVGQPKPPSLPPPIIVKFASLDLRTAFMRNKRVSIPPVTEAERAAGVKKILAVEDLTGPSHKKMRELIAEPAVEKVWSVDGRLRFTLVSDNAVVHRVKSVFDSVASIINCG
jgi:hypothetical protein